MKHLFFVPLIALCLNFSHCHEGERQHEFIQPRDTAYLARTQYLSVDSILPLTFFHMFMETSLIRDTLNVLTPLPFMVFEGNPTSAWITEQDVQQLVPMMYSQEQCKCYVKSISSFLPFDSSAQVGGFAIEMVKAFKEKRAPFPGTYDCPKFNRAEADTLSAWWQKQQNMKQ